MCKVILEAYRGAMLEALFETLALSSLRNGLGYLAEFEIACGLVARPFLRTQICSQKSAQADQIGPTDFQKHT